MNMFNNRFKSLVDKAKQKAEELKNDERVIGAISQAKQTISDYQDKFETFQYNRAMNFVNEGNYEAAVGILEKVPESHVSYIEAQEMLPELREKLYASKLQKAASLSSLGNFKEAVLILESIPEMASVYSTAQDNIFSYREQHLCQILASSEGLAREENFLGAIQSLEEIPESSNLYSAAQEAKSRYLKEHHLYLLRKADQLAEESNLEAALSVVNDISDSSEIIELVREKRNQLIRSQHSLVIEKAQKHVEDGDFESAVSTLQSVPQGSQLYAEAQNSIVVVNHKVQEKEIEKLYQQAWDFFNDACYADSLKLLNDILAKNAEHTYSNALRGCTRAAMGDKKGGLQDIEKAMSLDSSNLEFLYMHGSICLYYKDYKTGISDFSSIISVEQNNGNAYLSRGLCHAGLKQKKRALSDIDTASQIFFSANDTDKYQEAVNSRNNVENSDDENNLIINRLLGFGSGNVTIVFQMNDLS